MIEQILR